MAFKVLVTGFGPYGNTKLNPSLAVVQRLQQDDAAVRLDGVTILARQVSSEFNTCIKQAGALIDELSPDACVMLGEYPGRAMVTAERAAINYDDSTRYGVKDEAGYAPQGTPVVAGGPAAYFSTLPLRRIVRDLRANGVPADISGDSGTLMCNHLMYGVIHRIETGRGSYVDGRGVTPAGWIHLPVLPETAALEENLGMPSMTAELSTRAVLCIIESIVADAQAGGGDINIPIKSRLLV